MFHLGFDYTSCVANSEKVAWRLDDVMPRGTHLDFLRPFLPEELVTTRSISCLNDHERCKLNQIFGNAYLNLFAFVEEYILVAVLLDARAEIFGDRPTMRALCRFADEEIKHQMLFQRYREEFNRGFGHACGVLESAFEATEMILQRSPIAVMVLTLHLELMTQAHYIECVKDNSQLDPLFANLLKYHWMEEAQHAKLDMLQLQRLVVQATPREIERAIDEYLKIVRAFDGMLMVQANMDIESLAAVTRRSFRPEEVDEIRAALNVSYRKTFLTSGMTNQQFVKILGHMSKAGQARVAAQVIAFQQGISLQ
jgi:hypothetical protein